MQKALKHGSVILSRVLFIGMSVQIVLGVLWVLYHLGMPTEYGDGGFYETAAANLDLTGCTGVLYPFIVKLVMGMAQIVPIPYYCIVYLLQLVLAMAAGRALLCAVIHRPVWQLYFGAAAMATVPMALQCHLGVLPYSLAGSLLTLELAWGIRGCLGKEGQQVSGKYMALAGICWLLAVLTAQEYVWIGWIPLVVLPVLRWGRTKQWKEIRTCLMLLVVTTVVVLGGFWGQKKVITEYQAPSFKQAVVARCVWSSMLQVYDSWPEELKAVLPQETVLQVSLRPESLREELYLGFEGLDEEQEKQYLDWMLDSALGVRRNEILVELAYDVVGYALPGIMIERQLDGRGLASMTGLNYRVWTDGNNLLGKEYLHYYCWWFWVAALLAVICRLLQWGSTRMEVGRKSETRVGLGICSIGMIGVLTLYYTLTRVGTYDYKLAAWGAGIWYLCTLLMIPPFEKELQEREEEEK